MAMPSPLPQPKLPPLASVRWSLLMAAPQLAVIPHVADLISAFQDVSVLVSPVQAAASGSVARFTRVAARVLTPPMVDAALRSHWLAHALEAAIQKNDLAMVQTIHGLHPEPLAVRSLDAALAHGTLELVQWVIEHRCDRLCCQPGVQNLCVPCLSKGVHRIGDQDTYRIIRWIADQGTLALRDLRGANWLLVLSAMRKSPELVQWFDDQGWLRSGAIVTLIVETAIAAANRHSLVILRRLIGRATTMKRHTLIMLLINTSFKPNQEELIEVVLSSSHCRSFRKYVKYKPIRPGGAYVLQWDPALRSKTQLSGVSLTRAITRAAEAADHRETLQWLATDCGVATTSSRRRLPEAELASLHETNTRTRMTTQSHERAAPPGALELAEWVRVHRHQLVASKAMDVAAGSGHLNILRWLHERVPTSCSSKAMDRAAYNGHLEIVQWLSNNRPESQTSSAMRDAALGGQLDVLVWLDASTVDSCTQCVLHSVLSEDQYAMHGEMGGAPVLHTLQWLDAHAVARVGCEAQCLVSETGAHVSGNLTTFAIAAGDLALLQYLHDHHADALAWRRPYHRVASALANSGHVGVVQWLYENYTQEFDWIQVYKAASTWGKTPVVQWLLEGVPEIRQAQRDRGTWHSSKQFFQQWV